MFRIFVFACCLLVSISVLGKLEYLQWVAMSVRENFTFNGFAACGFWVAFGWLLSCKYVFPCIFT